ncbi:MAG: segregation and condensation protein A [Actinomycetota bacterium]
MAYEVRTEVFEGPIDLLLHLITRQRVDIYEIPLATITEEYLAAVGALEPLDLESATGFLVVAATLLELKSARLLPTRGVGEEDEYLLEQRDLLLARLVECATFRDAGVWMGHRIDQGAGFHPRRAGLEEPFVDLIPDLLADTRVEHLAGAAAVALAPRPTPVLDTSHVTPITASVRDALREVAGHLRGRDEVSFEALCSGVSERIEVVVRFLALLELFKAGAVELAQPSTFGSIRARWTGEVDEDDIIRDVEEYSAAGEAG